MTIDTVTRTDTQETLPVDQIREQAGLPRLERQTGGWVPNPLTAEQPVVRNDVDTPLFDELRASYDLKPDWWWEEKFTHITDELRAEVEVEHLEQLSADIADAVVQVHDDEEVFATIHGVNPAGPEIELDEEDLMPHQVAAMPEADYVAPSVAGQRYDEQRGWYDDTRVEPVPRETHTRVEEREVLGLTFSRDEPRQRKRWWERLADWLGAY